MGQPGRTPSIRVQAVSGVTKAYTTIQSGVSDEKESWGGAMRLASWMPGPKAPAPVSEFRWQKLTSGPHVPL